MVASGVGVAKGGQIHQAAEGRGYLRKRPAPEIPKGLLLFLAHARDPCLRPWQPSSAGHPEGSILTQPQGGAIFAAAVSRASGALAKYGRFSEPVLQRLLE